jgi:SAM-dependent methyltransferase
MAEVRAADTPGRYSSVFAHHVVDDEGERLRSLAEALDAGTIELLSALRPRPDWRCLEIGAGLGTVASWLARRCPAGEVVATDLSLEYLKQVSGPNLVVIKHDVTDDGFPEQSLDLVFARFVFAHLPTREETLARAATWLAPGGWLVLEDPARFPLDSSPHPRFRKVGQAVWRILAEQAGTDPDWARSYPEPLARLGLERLGLRVALPVVGPGTAIGRHFAATFRRVAPEVVAAGLASEEEVGQVVDEMFRDGFQDLAGASVAAWGRRPL